MSMIKCLCYADIDLFFFSNVRCDVHIVFIAFIRFYYNLMH